MCAIGIFMTDEEATRWEGRYSYNLPLSIVPQHLRVLASSCQAAHDNQLDHPKPKFKPGLRAVAEQYGLVWKY